MPLAVPGRGRMATLAAAAFGLCHWAVAAAAVSQAALACAAGGPEAEAGACPRPEATLRPEKDHLLVQIGRGLAPPRVRSAGAAAVSDKAKEPLQEVELVKEAAAVDEAKDRVERIESPVLQGGGGVIGWSTSGEVKSAGQWCQVNVPPAGWHLKACPVSGGSTPVKVLSYNLFWWNLYGMRHGNGGSAGRKIAETSGPEEYDLMGFQECDEMSRILGDAHAHGLGGSYELVSGGRALAIAWRKSSFTWLAEGKGDVGEDHQSQYYGKRAAQWVRLRHNGGRTVFFLNHHGPLPVSQSGGCTGSSTAYNILKMIGTNAHKDDVIIVVGDFNAEGHSSRVRALEGYLNHVFSGTSMGGVDHIFSNCYAVSQNNLGKGGSDHDALSAVFRI